MQRLYGFFSFSAFRLPHLSHRFITLSSLDSPLATPQYFVILKGVTRQETN